MRIFISYSVIDKSIVEIIERQLKNAGLTVLRDKEFLKSGDEWEEKIVGQIKSCDGFLLVVSQNSIDSENVTDEVLKARKYHKTIYPFIINNAPHFPILKNLHHHKFEGSLSVNDITKIFKVSMDDLSSNDVLDIVDAVNKYKSDTKRINNRFKVLNQGNAISIESIYVDCCLQRGIEFDDSNAEEKFFSRDLIDYFGGGLFIITGHPGTGKTSLLSHLAYKLSLEEYRFLPICVHLKNYDPNFISFDDFIASGTGNLV